MVLAASRIQYNFSQRTAIKVSRKPTNMADLQIDAASGGIALDRKLKLQLCKQLTTSDLHAIKFLLWSEHIATSEIEKMESTRDLLQNMEQKGLLGENNGQLLGELLYFTHKIKCLKMLGYDPKQFKQFIESGGLVKLSPYKILLIKLYYDMGSDEVETLKFLSEKDIGRHDTGKLQDALSLFMALEDRQLLSCDDVSYLIDLLESIDRPDLLRKVEQYNGHCVPSRKFNKPEVKSGLNQPSHILLPNNKTFEPAEPAQIPLPLRPACRECKSDTSKMLPSGAKTPGAQKPLAPYVGIPVERRFAQGTEKGIPTHPIDTLRYLNAIENIRQNVNRPQAHVSHQMEEVEEEKKKKSYNSNDARLNTEQPVDISMNTSSQGSDAEESENHNIPLFVMEHKDDDKDNDAVLRQASEEPEDQIGRSNLNKGQSQPECAQRSSGEVLSHLGRPSSAEREESATSDPNVAGSSHGNLMVNKGEAHVTENQNTVLNQHASEHATAQTNQPRLQQEQVSDGQELQEEKDDEMPCYKMNRQPRGYCLIINNEHFNGPEKMTQRFGTDIDEERLNVTFTKLGFKVVIRKNLTAEEMTRLLLDFALNKNHDQFDCFACCILTHGDLGRVFGVDEEAEQIKNLTGFFRPHSCPSLAGKPKLFFIQACQGEQRQHVYKDIQIDDASGPAAGARPVETIPNETDFLVGYATVPGFVSYRSKSKGTWYITKLTETLNKYSRRYDLLSMLTKVNEEVARGVNPQKDGKIYGQVPAPMSTLRRRLFFQQASSN